MRKKYPYIKVLGRWTCILILLLGMSLPSAESATVSKVLGIASQCDTTLSGCIQTILGQGVILCTGATCPSIFSADYTRIDNFVGIGVGGCRFSTNGGSVWNLCTAQPPGAGTFEGIAVTGSGAWVSIKNSGSTCVIGRSTDQGTIWATVNTFGSGCPSNANNTTNIRCFSSTCQIGVDNTNIGIYGSTDDGLSWGYTITSVKPSGPPRGLVFDGTNGFYIGSLAGLTISTSTGSSGWTFGAAGFNPGGTCFYGINDSVLGPVTYCGGRTPRQFVNIQTSVVTNVTLTNSVVQSNVQVLQIGSQIYIFGASINTTSCSGNIVSLWVSIDHGTTFTELQCLSGLIGDGGDYAVVGQYTYFTTAGSNAFIRFTKS